MPRPKGFDPAEALDAAMQAFCTRGYEGTSAQDLCDSTGLGRSSLYNTFDSKDALYSRCLDRFAELQTLGQTEILDGPGSGYQRIRTLLLATVDDEDRPDATGCLITRTAVERDDAVVTETVRRLMDTFVARITGTIAEGQADGSITTRQSATALARFVHGAISGLRVQGRAAAPRDLLTDVVEVTCTALRA
ncbi:TetR/AcrR family transcriptional regulator [Cryptosporangium arvum]|uniref:TetR/AcrR family transcriptional regulator n=1 Tax=Cryptosporangium arvum TaxID=80871 RepID=UPI0004BC4EF2|nr:TetR/AcrR family transcriptional regulator [Cryptosporangium arvum]